MKIAATVVTYNRLDCLKRCIESIRKQSFQPAGIIVINNGSTDGTLQWLTEQQDLIVVSQENTGSGGGQYCAMLMACKLGYDWVWTMDDDGFVEVDTLEKLVTTAEKNPAVKVLNSIVLSKENPDVMAFEYYLDGNFFLKKKGKRFLFYEDLLKACPGNLAIGNPQFFNSTFVSSEVIKQVGLPISELFIRGDEIEYVFRIQNKGWITATVLDSRMYHPRPELDYKFGLLGRELILENMNPIKKYYATRNKIVIEKFYYRNTIFVSLRMIIRELLGWFYSKDKHNSPFKDLYRILVDAWRFDLQDKIQRSIEIVKSKTE